MDITPETAKSWPFEQARQLLQHIVRKGKVPGDRVTFETGYGPSGAPHIGTFGEVVRTLMVMRAFIELTDGAYQTRLVIFSDDYDGFRKVPDNMPESMNEHLGMALSRVPDPYGDFSSFSARNNDALVGFVRETLGIPVNIGWFVSSTAAYQGGYFNSALSLVFENHDKILEIMKANLGEERQASYCAFMPVTPTGHVIHTGVRTSDSLKDLVEFEDEFGAPLAYSIHDGNVKLQWKVDWAMRWLALDVDYEMSGKDLIDSVKASNKICRVLGGTPPLNMTYELFLDEHGQKISKSKGNGVSMEQWFRYGNVNSLAHFMYQNPRAAKQLHLGVIPRVTDEYLKQLADYLETPSINNPVWAVHLGQVPEVSTNVTYQLMINLAEVSAVKDPAVLMGYLGQYREISDDERPILEEMASFVVNYVNDVGTVRKLREPSAQEAAAFLDLADRLAVMADGLAAEDYQFQVYEAGKAHAFEPLRAWFQAIYEVLFGSSDGPRFGTFIASYGVQQSVELLRKAAAGVAPNN
jgi:lysyl-tRNA synthetase class 1